VGPGNHGLDGVQLPMGRDNFEGKGRPIVKYIGTLCGPDPHGRGLFWGKGAPIVKYRDFLPCAVQKRLN